MSGSLEASQGSVEVLAGMLRRGGGATKAIMRVCMCLLSIPDALHIPRTHLLMGKIAAALRDNHTCLDSTEVALDMLLRMAKRYPEVREWMHDNADELQWARGWLAARKSGLAPPGSIPTSTATPTPTPTPTSTPPASAFPRASKNKNGFGTPSVMLTTLELLLGGQDMNAGSVYDSDDEIDYLVGKRVKVGCGWELWGRVGG